MTGNLIDKIATGIDISDSELQEALAFYRQMEEGLRVLGAHFHLAWYEVIRRLQTLEEFQVARQSHALLDSLAILGRQLG